MERHVCSSNHAQVRVSWDMVGWLATDDVQVDSMRLHTVASVETPDQTVMRVAKGAGSVVTSGPWQLHGRYRVMPDQMVARTPICLFEVRFIPTSTGFNATLTPRDVRMLRLKRT